MSHLLAKVNCLPVNTSILKNKPLVFRSKDLKVPIQIPHPIPPHPTPPHPTQARFRTDTRTQTTKSNARGLPSGEMWNLQIDRHVTRLWYLLQVVPQYGTVTVYASRITDTPGPDSYTLKIGPAGNLFNLTLQGVKDANATKFFTLAHQILKISCQIGY